MTAPLVVMPSRSAAMLRDQLEEAPRHAPSALAGLVGVGRGAERDALARAARPGQRAARSPSRRRS